MTFLLLSLLKALAIVIVITVVGYNDFCYFMQPNVYKTLSPHEKHQLSFVKNHLDKIKGCRL